ncbi:MAG: FliA/WhiG family RNA polymerase sigma factor [Acidobacteria bacterium]|nr:FliA/WhiG family RNA polymerase sigma factor [Acidobacteriota bacterium]
MLKSAEAVPARRPGRTRLTAREREAMILEHLPLIKYVVHRIGARLPPQVDREDLIQAGILGLIDAIEKFEPDRGIKFKTYAELRVRGAILDSLREVDWVPRNLRRQSRDVQRAYADLEQELGRPATDQEVAARIGMSLEEFQKLLDQLRGINIGSIQQSGSNGGEEDADPIEYCLEAGEETSPTVLVEKIEMRRILGEAIDLLPQNEKLVVSLYYYDELTMKEISAVLSVNESRISQLHTKAMLRLRGKLQLRLSGRS